MKWKRSTIVFNIGIAGVAWLFINCGWGGYEEPPSFFAPETGLHGKSHLMFYAPNTVFYNQGSMPADFTEINIKDWSQFLGRKLSMGEIRFWLTEANIEQADACLQYLQYKNKQIKDTALLKHALRLGKSKKIISFIKYLHFALPLQQDVVNHWDYFDIINKDTAIVLKADSLLLAMQTQAAKEKSPFMRTRYYFQIERLYHLSEKYDEGIVFWKSHQKSLIKNSCYYRYMGYAAACYYKKRDYEQSNYLYSLIYDQYEPMQNTSLWSFGVKEAADWESCLKLAKNEKEKCTLWQMYGYQNNETEAIAAIYKIDPKSEKLTVLLLRMVNMQEARFIPNYYNNSEPIKDINLRMGELEGTAYDLVDHIIYADSTADPGLWHLVNSYFNIVMGDYDKAKLQLQIAAKKKNPDKLFQSQLHIVQLLWDIKNTTNINENDTLEHGFENRIVDDFRWIGSHSKDTCLRTSDLLIWCRNYLSVVYQTHSNLFAAECFRAGSNVGFYTVSNIDSLIAFLNKPHKTAFEQMLTSIYEYKERDLLELKMYLLLYSGDFLAARALNNEKYFTGTESNYFMNADPFIIHIRDCHDCDAEAPQEKKYNSGNIIDTLAKMEIAAATNPALSAEIYFSMANCLYNITYYGNSRVFYSIRIGTYNSDYFNPSETLPSFNCNLSEAYYRKAMNASTNKEFKAKCMFMISKCRQNEEYNLSEKERANEEISDDTFVTRDTCFYELKTEYAQTEYYKQIIKECGYFVSYLK